MAAAHIIYWTVHILGTGCMAGVLGAWIYGMAWVFKRLGKR